MDSPGTHHQQLSLVAAVVAVATVIGLGVSVHRSAQVPASSLYAHHWRSNFASCYERQQRQAQNLCREEATRSTAAEKQNGDTWKDGWYAVS